MVKSISVALLVVVATACAQPIAQTSSEIEAQSGRWLAALNGGDVTALAAFYTEDCHVLPPNDQLQTGRGAVEKIFGAMIDAGLTGEIDTLEASSAGDLGFHLGRYTILAPDGSAVDNGKFIEIWRQVQGEWKLANDIWNSDLSVAAAGNSVIYTHEVADPDIWLAAWLESDSRRTLFAENGASGVRIFQSPENPNLTGLLVDVTDLEALQGMIGSPEGQAAAGEDTVQFDTIQMLVEVH